MAPSEWPRNRKKKKQKQDRLEPTTRTERRMNLGKLAITLPAPFLSASQCVDLARKAEDEWGYEAIWLAETGGAESFALAGALAQATRKVEIGTAIVPTYNRTPAVLASAAGTVAQLSNDRFILGLGTSSHAIIEQWNGVPFEQPLARVRDTVGILRQALSGDRTDYDGETLRSHGFRLGALPGKPMRIYLAGLREKMLELAGEIGEGLIINFMPADAMPKILGAYRTGAERAGRDGSGDEVVARFQVGITDDVESARKLVRAAFGGYVATPVYNRFFEWVGFGDVAKGVKQAFAAKDRAGSAAAMTDDFIDRVTILGTAEECREKLAGFVAAGVTTPILSPLAASPQAAEEVFSALSPSRS
jgi:probable F420-dependent oxidoreductase